ncbi:phenylalanine--tRNA ligase subunit alpha, partial [Candidatus Woesearchaeota archaeon]|nr:phenylalanine--tRNA ligase subunit alpha [Candidatus Woesearchaeota archaeon]
MESKAPLKDIGKIVQSLHPLERKVLPLIKATSSFNELVKGSGLKDVEVMRALQWLQNKSLIEIKEEVKEVIELDDNGRKYSKNGLPERRVLEALKKRAIRINELPEQANITRDELGICIGVLKGKAAITIDRGELDITGAGEKALEKKSLEEQFLEKLAKENIIELVSLKDEEKYAFEKLRSRKNIIRVSVKKLRSAYLTDLGKKVAARKLEGLVVDVVTPEMLKNGSWKKKDFRSYDVEINVPKIYGGKRHFVKQATDYAKKIWMDMGFKEMTGNFVGTSFWNFDALFTPQDHPVRELQDTFFIADPAKGKLPKNMKLVDAVKKAHEQGTKGSTGWKYKWNADEAKRNVLRTHTTILSAQTISMLKKTDLPGKYFALGRCFRNETMDWSHLFEFNQTEGIVIDPDANFRHLLGYLKQF